MVEVLVDEKEYSKAGPNQQRKLPEYAKRLREELYLGDLIRRRQIPSRFKNLQNLFRLELPGGWQALYTVASSPVAGEEVRIVWIGDHNRYNRLFRY